MQTVTSYKDILSPKLFKTLFIEFGPIIFFAVAFHFLGAYNATRILMLTTVISTIAIYRLEKRIPYITLYVTFLTILFGYITLHKHNIDFLQIRDSVYDFTLALTLLVGLLFNTLLLKVALSPYLELKDSAWRFFTYTWITFFFISGLLNEYIRQGYDINTWLVYKVVMIGITIFFTFVALHMTLKRNNQV